MTRLQNARERAFDYGLMGFFVSLTILAPLAAIAGGGKLFWVPIIGAPVSALVTAAWGFARGLLAPREDHPGQP